MNPFLKERGGYRSLKVFHMTEIICDLSVYFARKHIPYNSRTKDQMEQAARSGKQNIAEGSKASMTSRETEIKLTNVAKASLEELLLDYEDYLRQHNLSLWTPNYARTIRLRQYLKSDRFMSHPMEFATELNVEEFCNMMITLINQATYMLRRLIMAQQDQFLNEGGIREQMTKARRSIFQSKKPPFKSVEDDTKS